MSASSVWRPHVKFQIVENNEVLVVIRADGTIERGPGFTTIDEMSLKFWEAVENARRPLPPRGAPSIRGSGD